MNRFFNQILEKYILIYEHFNWLIYSLSIYFKDIFYENENNKIKEKFFIMIIMRYLAWIIKKLKKSLRDLNGNDYI